MIERVAHAKVNLALHVTGEKDDGYHLLDSLVVFAEYGDIVRVSKPHHAHGPIEISVDGPFSEGLTSGPENLVTAAAFLLREQIVSGGGEAKPVSITLTKNLPVASGIGGGSADAAATLLALQDYWESDIELEKIALGLGADVPMCLQSQPMRTQGIGDEITLLKADRSFHIVLINPGITVSTPEVFNRLQNKENAEIAFEVSEEFPDMSVLKNGMRNDLEKPATELCPDINTLLQILNEQRPLLARMSGSGATCFGLFSAEEEAASACRQILKTHPDWWCVATQTTLA